MVESMTFGEALREARKAAGLSQTALARRVGADQTSISEIELDKRRCRYELVCALADALLVERGEWIRLAGYPAPDERVPRDEMEARLLQAVWAYQPMAEMLRVAMRYQPPEFVDRMLAGCVQMAAKYLEVGFRDQGLAVDPEDAPLVAGPGARRSA